MRFSNSFLFFKRGSVTLFGVFSDFPSRLRRNDVEPDTTKQPALMGFTLPISFSPVVNNFNWKNVGRTKKKKMIKAHGIKLKPIEYIYIYAQLRVWCVGVLNGFLACERGDGPVPNRRAGAFTCPRRMMAAALFSSRDDVNEYHSARAVVGSQWHR